VAEVLLIALERGGVLRERSRLCCGCLAALEIVGAALECQMGSFTIVID
jgi:hypothetical protein